MKKLLLVLAVTLIAIACVIGFIFNYMFAASILSGFGAILSLASFFAKKD